MLHGEPSVPREVIGDGEQQSFLDARRRDDEDEPSLSQVTPESFAPPASSPSTGEESDLPHINWEEQDAQLPPVPEDDELDDPGWGIRPGIFDADEDSEGTPFLDEIGEERNADNRTRPRVLAEMSDQG